LKAIADALDFPCTSIVALPLVIRGKLYGVLELLNRTGEKTFSAQDVEMLTYLCQMASKAIEIRLMIGWAAKVIQTKGEAA
ncbi:MAG: GAF domain-containing protein, partial [Bdellovibrionota bacterium]